MNIPPVRFGLIGAGGIGAVRAAALRKSSDGSLSAVYDLDATRPNKLKGAARAFGSLEEFLEQDFIDAVVISTPPDTHCSLAVKALQSGKHVLVEKPMAGSLSECRQMIDAAAAARRVLAVGFNHRYFKGVAVVRNAIRNRTIGRLSYIRAFSGHTGLSEFKSEWMYSKSVMGGGTLMDNGIHLLDLVNHLMGNVSKVDARIRNDVWGLEVEDNAFLHLTDDNGVLCDLHSSWTEWKGYRFFLEAYGDRGVAQMYYAPMFARVIIMDQPRLSSRKTRFLFPLDIVREKIFGWQSTVVETFAAEFQDFIALTRNAARDTTIATAADGYRAIEIANAAYESSAGNHSVEVFGLQAPNEQE